MPNNRGVRRLHARLMFIRKREIPCREDLAQITDHIAIYGLPRYRSRSVLKSRDGGTDEEVITYGQTPHLAALALLNVLLTPKIALVASQVMIEETSVPGSVIAYALRNGGVYGGKLRYAETTMQIVPTSALPIPGYVRRKRSHHARD